MSKKKSSGPIIGIIIVVSLLAGGLVWLFVAGGSQTSQESMPPGAENVASSGGELSAKSTDFDFGTVKMANGKVRHEYVLANNSPEDVTITEVFTSCMCTKAELIDSQGKKQGTFGMPGHGKPTRTSLTVAANDTLTLNAIFDPAAHGPEAVGPVKRIVTIKTNSSKTPEIEVKFKANVVNPT